jgi:ABC-type amino acid transport substrate-binding protein
MRVGITITPIKWVLMITLSLVCSRAVYAGAGASAGASAIADTDTQAKPIRNSINVAFVDAPPFSYLDSETRESGTLVELFREVAQQLALEPVFI